MDQAVGFRKKQGKEKDILSKKEKINFLSFLAKPHPVGNLSAFTQLLLKIKFPSLVYTIFVYIFWDPEKTKINLKKHVIRFSDAEIILSDPNALTRDTWGIAAACTGYFCYNPAGIPPEP